MMLIVNFGQVIDLEHGGGFSYQFTVVLPDGMRVPIATDEGTVRQLMEAMVEPGKQPVRGNNHPRQQPIIDEEAFHREMDNIEGVYDEDPDDGEIFGGDYDPEGVAAQAASSISPEPESVMGAVVEQAIPQAPPATGLGQGSSIRIDGDGFALPPTARTVQADAKGYPIVPGGQPEPTIPDDDGEDDGTQM